MDIQSEVATLLALPQIFTTLVRVELPKLRAKFENQVPENAGKGVDRYVVLMFSSLPSLLRVLRYIKDPISERKKLLSSDIPLKIIYDSVLKNAQKGGASSVFQKQVEKAQNGAFSENEVVFSVAAYVPEGQTTTFLVLSITLIYLNPGMENKKKEEIENKEIEEKPRSQSRSLPWLQKLACDSELSTELQKKQKTEKYEILALREMKESQLQLRVAETTRGKGVFALTDFEKGKVVSFIDGEIAHTINDLMWDPDQVLDFKSQSKWDFESWKLVFENYSCEQKSKRHCNLSGSVLILKMETETKTFFFLVTNQNIKKGQELSRCYGRVYWIDQYVRRDPELSPMLLSKVLSNEQKLKIRAHPFFNYLVICSQESDELASVSKLFFDLLEITEK